MDILNVLLFPPTCVNCGALGSHLCKTCRCKIKIIDFPLCIVCDALCTDWKPHRKCKTISVPELTISPFVYESVVKKIVIKSKHSKRSYKLLDSLLNHPYNNKLVMLLPDFDIILPIPMSTHKIKGRILNHARYIANYIGKKRNRPVLPALKKTTGTTPQKVLPKNERYNNLAGKIKIKKRHTRVIKNKNILLVDDIVTSGATLRECTRILKKNSAEKIFAYTLSKDLRYNRLSQ